MCKLVVTLAGTNALQTKFPRIILEMYLWAIETGLSKTETAFLPYFQ